MASAYVTLDQVKTYLRIPSADTSQDAQLSMFITDVGSIFANFLRGRVLFEDVYTEFFQGNGTRFVVLNQVPVQEILNVWLDYNGYYGQGVNPDGTIPFAPATLQAPGTYDLVLDGDIDGPSAAWDGSTDYLPGNIVSVSSQAYMCILANTGITPPNTTYWRTCRSKIQVSRSGLLARVNWNWPDIGALYLPGNIAREAGQFLGNIKIQYRAGYPDGYLPADLQYAARLQISIMRKSSDQGGRLASESDSVTGYSYSLMNPRVGEAPEIGSIRQILTRYRLAPSLGGQLDSLPSNASSGAWR